MRRVPGPHMCGPATIPRNWDHQRMPGTRTLTPKRYDRELLRPPIRTEHLVPMSYTVRSG